MPGYACAAGWRRCERRGGRWNSPGHSIVYIAESISLAVLENLVHMSKDDFPVGYVSVSAIIPDDLRILTEADIRMNAPDAGPKEVGDYWFTSALSAVLRVGSFVVSGESNFLLNPTHPEFGRIIIEPPIPFSFDPRFFV